MNSVLDLHIVIAEDDEDDAIIMQDSFAQNSSFKTVTLVKNGQELIDYLEKKTTPDVILTDINMPIMDGIEALKIIFENNRLHQIPCFVYSTSINPSYEIVCKNLGVKAYLIKPNSFEDFNKIPAEIVSVLSKDDKYS